MQHWRGKYSFDDRFEFMFPNGLRTVHFEFTFRVRLLGFLTGELRDSAGGVPEPATVYGRIVANESIWFTKTYPRTWATAPETGEQYVFDNRKHVVRYQGDFEGPKTISGAWEIRSQRRVLNGTEYELPRLTGTWIAEEF